jgi:hypothetical protein
MKYHLWAEDADISSRGVNRNLSLSGLRGKSICAKWRITVQQTKINLFFRLRGVLP